MYRAAWRSVRSFALTDARALGVCVLILGFFAALQFARAGDSASIQWSSVTQAQVKVDQTTPLTWGVYQAEKKGKTDKKHAHLVLVLIGHRYLLVDLKAKRVYEVARKELHASDEGFKTGELITSSRLIPTSDWMWRNVGPAEMYRVTLGDYGRILQITLPHVYLISPYY